MTSRVVFAIVTGLLGAGLLAGCGGGPSTPSIDELLQAGGEAFARGDRHMEGGPFAVDAPPDGDARAAAVDAWREAAGAYRDAFRLLDPVPAAKDQRAMIAFRIARSLAKAAIHGVDPRWRDLRAEHALTWLAQAERLAPTMRQVWFERGTLYESEVEGVRDMMAAHHAYGRYLDLAAAAESISEAEQARLTHARTRVEALAPPTDVAPPNDVGPPK